MTTPDPLALAGQIQRERDSFIPGTALLRAWSQRHPAVTRLAEVVHAVERCGASTALTDVVVLCEVLRQTIHDALDQRDALAAALRAAHEENERLVTQAAELSKWRDAVLNAAIVDWTYRKEHETDPVRAVNDLVCYALDVEREALRKENRTMRVALEGLKAEMPRVSNVFGTLPLSGHGCTPMCAACRAELQNRMNPTGDPLGFNVERWLAGEESAVCGRHTPAQQVFAKLLVGPESGNNNNNNNNNREVFMDTQRQIVVGDWIRFRRNGALVVGVVQYVHASPPWAPGDWGYDTDAGAVPARAVVEVRPRA